MNRSLLTFFTKDNLDDTLEVLESIIFNTKVLDLKAINGDMTTHIILDEISAKEIGETLIAWANKEL